MANTDIPGSEARSIVVRQAPGDQSIHHAEEGTHADQTFAAYSFSAPEFRQSIRQLASTEQSRHSGQQHPADGRTKTAEVAPEVPPLLKKPDTRAVANMPEIPVLLKAPNLTEGSVQLSTMPSQERPKAADQAAAPSVPIAPAEQMEDKNKTIDPCTRKVVNWILPSAELPKAMDLVKDHDPVLFQQIQAKVTDPRYTGELGNITVSTHDKKGRVNGCIFVQNVPYWESGPAAQALVDVNKVLGTRGKKLEADPLNGAGRSLAQEEAIVWRNTGLHARVGKSNHGFGKAEDFKPDANPNATKQPWQDPFVNATLHAHGWRQGDSWGPLKNDLHHWSFVGPGPATDGHAPARTPTHVAHHRHR